MNRRLIIRIDWSHPHGMVAKAEISILGTSPGIFFNQFHQENIMVILFINNDGNGFADNIEVSPATTVAQLFEQRLPGRKAQDYLIRVNRQPVSADQVLQEGDRVSMTPSKIEGA